MALALELVMAPGWDEALVVALELEQVAMALAWAPFFSFHKHNHPWMLEHLVLMI